MPNVPKSEFVYRKHMSVGEADAENDQSFLEDCFVDIGDYEVLCNTSAPQCIVLGRTGAGKSALLEQVRRNQERVISIEPEELALRHISNSTILTFFENLGVNLDIFYNLLWQHTFAVELIKIEYKIDSVQKKDSFFSTVSSLIKGNSKKQQALSYIEEWGEKFWLDTESRIKDFTEKLESNLKQTVSGKVPGIELKISSGKSLTEEQKSEVIYYGKRVVSDVQISKLSKIIELLSEDIFNDPQKKTYIVIDRLDENWVEDHLRYKLIRALIETTKKFRSIEPVKIIFTLRTDLLNRVLDQTRDSGFQKEKYDSLFLTLRWEKLQIKSILDKRINKLLKNKYTKNDVFFDDIFPPKLDGLRGDDYIIDRTFLRPRDAIAFVNHCLIESEGKTEITGSIVKMAEKGYSYDRLESLKYEWFVEHPNLEKYIDMLHKMKKRFKVGIVDNSIFDKLIEKLFDQDTSRADDVVKLAYEYINNSYPKTEEILTELKQKLFFTLYKVGVVGIKVDGVSSVKWIQNRTQDLNYSKINNNSIIYIHKVLWRVLAINTTDK
ncbi:P-loop ATPase, Sll1717 family [Gynuella sunshinyii]|uniref:DNA repair ATPase n=1 Tax=Gynuella sunshinyii YC6258 TaxID=1445510 RepID=A0A0C5VLF2_9GAMM|nr:hypothetical protein [Gynuella sunshinyii]AJQ94168.1 hypothetical Protein YC6258_02130 [Gynuella sunshinyii YC6258]